MSHKRCRQAIPAVATAPIFGLASGLGPADSSSMGYFRDHWRGRHPLSRTFWINFLIPFVLIAMVEPWIRPSAGGGTAAHGVLAALYVLIAHAVVLPWQVVGLWRSSRRHLQERGELVPVTFAQGIVLIALVTAAGATTTTVQRIFGFGIGAADDAAAPSPRYVLDIIAGDRTVLIEGPFDTGISRDLKALLAETAEVDTIVLNSDGGRVFEARGVAGQIAENGLDTLVVDRCRSACTIAFIAGSTRRLGARAKIGFHSYRMDAALAFSNPLDEQEKDKAFFLRQGVQADFVDRVFAVPHEDMWHPDVDQLMRARVVHGVVGDRLRQDQGDP